MKNIFGKTKLILILVFFISQGSYAESPYPTELPNEKPTNTKTIKTKQGSEHRPRILNRYIDQTRIQSAEKENWEFEGSRDHSGHGLGVFGGMLLQESSASGTSGRASFGVFGEGRFSNEINWVAVLGQGLFPLWETSSMGLELGFGYRIYHLEFLHYRQGRGKNLLGTRLGLSIPLGSLDMRSGVSWRVRAGLGILTLENPSPSQNSTLFPIHAGVEGEFGTFFAGLNWRAGIFAIYTPSAVELPNWGGLLRLSFFVPM